jgi:hypothetical protein
LQVSSPCAPLQGLQPYCVEPEPTGHAALQVGRQGPEPPRQPLQSW